MTHEEIFWGSVDLLNQGRFDEAAALLADDVVWYPRLAAVDAGALRGRSVIAQTWREQVEAFGGVGSLVWEVLTVEALGAGTLLAEVRMSGKGAASGVAVEDRFAMLVVFRNGKAVRVDSYDDRAAALADLGEA